jgi:amino acid adenylation domain-containing protein
MKSKNGLHHYVGISSMICPEQTAVEELDNRKINYQELANLSDSVRDRLHHLGVRRRDRVGLYVSKSIDAVASIFGILKVGAAYIPLDPNAPHSRNAYILSDCAAKAVIMEKRFRNSLFNDNCFNKSLPVIILEGTGGGIPLRRALRREEERDPAPCTDTVASESKDLAYILYTSGSTGKPKGVMLSHKNGINFIDWCSKIFRPNKKDRFSSHAPFHFDLSILDIFLTVKHGATLILISDDIGKNPTRLALVISEKKISIWYSTPSILSFLVQYGKLDHYEYSNLRIVLFAGEVFPIKNLRNLKNILSRPRYFNLYGPTETNVCTFYEIPEVIPEERTQPFPIGRTCSHLLSKVVDELGNEIDRGQEGELCIRGPGVMKGYWNLPEQSAQAFLKNDQDQGWYKTGDIVMEDTDGNYIYIGRLDRMVKKRGYRVELGEIETFLYSHPEVKEAAVVALSDEEDGVQIKAFLSYAGGNRPSIIGIKRFCAENLPHYMIPDFFSFLDVLPKTSTSKTDYQKLKETN